MAQLAELETALINADKAGDADGARILSGEIMRMRNQNIDGLLQKERTDQSSLSMDEKKELVNLRRSGGLSSVNAATPEEGGRMATAGMSGGEKFSAGMGKAVYDLGRGAGQMLGVVSDKNIEESRERDAGLMETGAGKWGNVAGNVLSAVPATFVPGANTFVGASLIGGGLGALQPTVGDESRLKNIGTGAAFGAGGYGTGKLLGKAVGAAFNKVANIESKVYAKAAEQAASETASARSAAGNAAQNAYRQLEHLRELKAMRGLTPEENRIAKELMTELAAKAQEKLIPAAALKESTAQAYQKAVANEATRASALAAEKLGTDEVKRQVMARLLRYGPAAAGGIVGNMIFPGLGGSVGGAATGLVLRPAIRSIVNLSKNPAVQRSLLSPVANAAALQNKNLPMAMALLASGGSGPADE